MRSTATKGIDPGQFSWGGGGMGRGDEEGGMGKGE